MSGRVLPDLGRETSLVRLGALVDGFLEDIGEFRPGEAWSDCAQRVEGCDPALAAWLREADRCWEAIERAGGDGTVPNAPGERGI